jgi:hypothetical protein
MAFKNVAERISEEMCAPITVIRQEWLAAAPELDESRDIF